MRSRLARFLFQNFLFPYRARVCAGFFNAHGRVPNTRTGESEPVHASGEPVMRVNLWRREWLHFKPEKCAHPCIQSQTAGQIYSDHGPGCCIQPRGSTNPARVLVVHLPAHAVSLPAFLVKLLVAVLGLPELECRKNLRNNRAVTIQS